MDVLVQAFVQGLTLAALYLPIALGLNLIFGVLHIINFAHGDLYMLGAMLTWWVLTAWGLGFVPSLVIAVVLVTLLGIAIERVLLRAMGHDVLAALVLSLGLGLVLQTSTLLLAGGGVKQYGFPVQGTVTFLGTRLSMERLSITLLGLLSVGLFYGLLQKTKLGKAIRAVAQDEEAATLQSINPATIRMVAMGLGTALAAIGGALSASVFGVDPYVGSGPLIYSFVIITLGGLGSMEGTLLAGLVLGMAESFITIYVGATEAAMAAFIVLYLVLLVRPSGLLGRARVGGGYL
jgi:branched-chain amino acid transport system permease protein